MSQPALDMLTLVNALVHYDEADYLYTLAASNFFHLDFPKSSLYAVRSKIRRGSFRAKADERDQTNYIISFMNRILVSSESDFRWESIISSIRTQPILQVLRKIYSVLRPELHYSSDPDRQHYYLLNVDLLFEQLINACNIDRLTINTLQETLYNSIVTKSSVDSRVPGVDNEEIPIQCITVHKSKGLEYGHVILPYCSAPISTIKKSQTHVSIERDCDRYRIGYSMTLPITKETLWNNYYDERTETEEKSREETRILYVGMTRAIRSFSWIVLEGKRQLSWQSLIGTEV